MATVDVLIAGGGVMGSAIAYFLAADPDFTGHVQVVEPDPSYQFASSPRSLGGVRQQFSNLENIQIGLFGHHFVTHVDHYLTVDGEAPALSFREGGYLFLASAEGLATLRENHAVQTAAGAAIDLLSPDDLAARFPWIDVAGLAGASLSAGGEGWLDPFALLQGFRKKARALGVEFIADKVTGVRRAAGRVTAVDLASGTRVAPGVLVNAAGAWAGEVAAQAGVALPVEPRRRMVYVFECRTPLDPPPPLTIDTSGVYLRPEGGGYLTGFTPPAAADPPYAGFEVEHHWFEEVVWPALAARVPAFEAIKVTSAWAGYYDYNTVDQNGIVGAHPEVANLIFANGFSGHGLQQSPAVGRAVSELIVHGGFRAIDLTRFGFERFAAGQPLIERNVV